MAHQPHTPPKLDLTTIGASRRQPPSQPGSVADRQIRAASRDQRTIAYVKKRRAEGKTRREIIRCLKRHIAREIYHLLTNPPPTPSGSHLRCLRQNNQTTLAQAATALHSHTTHISRLERGLYHNHQLATRYHQWLTTLTPHQNRI